MDIWLGFEDVPETLKGSVVTIGVFDGIHRGHKTLINHAVTRARALDVPSLLLTFNPHPLAILRPEIMPPMLGTMRERADLACGLGVDNMLALNFNASMASLSPEEFFSQVLVDTLHAKEVVVGENFTFGHKAQGTTQTLRELGQKYGVAVTVKELLAENGEVICSTLIRNSLKESNIQKANWALGRKHSVKGEVVRGAGRGGRELGFPTANLYFPDSVALPADGVYAGWLRVKRVGASAPIEGDMDYDTRYLAAISVGHNPTFGDERRSVESFVLDHHADLYGHTVIVEFVDFVRGMEKFNGVDELLEAMARDVEKTREILAKDAESSGIELP